MPENLYATDRADFEHLLTLGYTEVEATRLVYAPIYVHYRWMWLVGVVCG